MNEEEAVGQVSVIPTYKSLRQIDEGEENEEEDVESGGGLGDADDADDEDEDENEDLNAGDGEARDNDGESDDDNDDPWAVLPSKSRKPKRYIPIFLICTFAPPRMFTIRIFTTV